MYIFSYRKIVNIALSMIDSTTYDAYSNYFRRRKLKVTSTQFKQWREFMGLSQQEAARALGLSKGSIELYERGSRRDDDRPVVVPKAVELACAALMHGITSYNEPQPAPAGSFQVIRIDLGGYGEQISRTVIGPYFPTQSEAEVFATKEAQAFDHNGRNAELGHWWGRNDGNAGHRFIVRSTP